MTDDDANLIPADQPAYDLRLTAAELKVTYNALHAFFDDFGHEESDVHAVARGILAKMPGEPEIRAIDLDTELEKLRELRGE